MFSLKRPPDVVINGNENGEEYLRRWHIIPRNRWLNIYLHHFVGDDPGRDFHDHPWGSLSICLKGRMIESYRPRYAEETLWCNEEYDTDLVSFKTRVVRPGSIHYRRPTFLHRIDQILSGTWTLFITGPKVREWGFMASSEKKAHPWTGQPVTVTTWTHWKEYLKTPFQREIEAMIDETNRILEPNELFQDLEFHEVDRTAPLKYTKVHSLTGENND
jgi:hypothetical protein